MNLINKFIIGRDPDCTRRVGLRNVMMVALNEDVDVCRVRGSEGRDFYDENYLYKIATALVLDCPIN
jgi:hypothetical protein